MCDDFLPANNVSSLKLSDGEGGKKLGGREDGTESLVTVCLQRAGGKK